MKPTKLELINQSFETCNEELFKEHINDSIDYGVAYLLSSYTKDKNLAYDCVMAVIERLLTRFDSLCGKSDFRFSSYFIESCKNQYLSHKRKLIKSDTLEDIHNVYDASQNLYDILFSREQKEIFRRCLTKLNNHQLDFIAWLFRHPDAEIAEMEGHFSIAINAIYQKKHRIVKILQKCIGFFT